MIKGIIASVIATAICAFLGWLWFAFFATAFFVHPLAFVLFGAIALVAGLVVGGIVGWIIRKKQQDKEEERCIADVEREFRNMSFDAKGICYSPAKDGMREFVESDESKLRPDTPHLKEAEKAGFIALEQYGTHQYRIIATEKMISLFDAKPEMLQELYRDLSEDFSRNFMIQQTMLENGRMSSPVLVDKFTGEETDKWRIGGLAK